MITQQGIDHVLYLGLQFQRWYYPSSFANTHLSIVWILLDVFRSHWWMSDTCGISSILVSLTQLGFTFPVSYMISCILLAGTTALTHFVLASVALWNGRGGIQEPPYSCSNLWMTMPSLCVDRMGPYCICDHFFYAFQNRKLWVFFSFTSWKLSWVGSCLRTFLSCFCAQQQAFAMASL